MTAMKYRRKTAGISGGSESAEAWHQRKSGGGISYRWKVIGMVMTCLKRHGVCCLCSTARHKIDGELDASESIDIGMKA